MAEPRQVEEPKDGGSAQSMGLPTSGGDLSASSGPTPPLYQPVQQVGELAGPHLQFTTKGATRTCRGHFQPCVCSRLLCVSLCAAGTGSRLFRRHSLGFLRIGSSRAWTFPCRQLGLEAARPILPAWECWGRASPCPSPLGWSA